MIINILKCLVYLVILLHVPFVFGAVVFVACVIVPAGIIGYRLHMLVKTFINKEV